jgi:glycosyltransferase involved in cell wall biosynthesis/O-antigen/teichoic acid export membrane protein
MSDGAPGGRPRHILVLTDRDWTHPQGGGTGTNLYGQIARWVAWGHRVTVVAGDYRGAQREERLGPMLTIHRMGTRLTVFPRAAWAVWRGRVGHDADVVLEVINGITFFTPLWLRKPRVALVHHVHRRMYVEELGRRGAIAAWLLETIPLRLLYRGTPFLTISDAARRDLIAVGVPAEDIHVTYLGVEPAQFQQGERSPTPLLLYLGRVKQYKRIENVLDVLEAIPEARLEVAGDGTHRPVLEAEIAERGLADRVRLLGYVDEGDKQEIYSRAWVALTASSAEGWSLAVIEAAACGTPSAALRVGGLPESIVDGETGVLADDVPELTVKVREIVEHPDLRDRLGEAARVRARSLTWENTAEGSLKVLNAAAETEHEGLRDTLGRSQTLKAAGLAMASMAANAVQAIFVGAFAHILGAASYGSLARLVTAMVILNVPGIALQTAAARETALGRLGHGRTLASALASWGRHLAIASVGLAVVAVLLRHQLASVMSVDQEWAAAATVPVAALWLFLSLERGVLSGLHAYKPVGLSIIGEAVCRLASGLVLVAAGAGVTGAFLGLPIAWVAMSLVLALALRRRLGPPEGAPRRTLAALIASAWAPLGALTLVFLLQNIDVFLIPLYASKKAAGAYAGAATAAKVAIWVAVGIAIYLLPEAARRAAEGRDPRPVLARAAVLVSAVALPVLAIFAAVPDLLLRVALGPDFVQASSALLLLGLAMSLLAMVNLGAQYMLALFQYKFLFLLAAAVALEPVLLASAPAGLEPFAAMVLLVQCAAAAGMLVLCLRTRTSSAPSQAAAPA